MDAPKDIQDLLNELEDEQVQQEEPIQTITVAETPQQQEEITPKGVDMLKYLDRLDGVTEEVLNACRADRQEAQDVIGLLRSEINEAIKNNRPPARMYVDGLVKAVEVKSTINMTAVKMIEANAKILAATKVTGTNVQVNNNTVNLSSDADLEKILNEPLTSDDEY